MRKENCYYYVLATFVFGTIAAQNGDECITPDGNNGACIELKTCEKLRTMMENRRHIDAVRVLLQKSFCGYAGRNPKVCCPAEQPSQQFRPGAVTGVAAGPNRRTEPTAVLPAKNACGRPGHNRTNDDRIYGGVDSKLGAWPWIAAIGYQSTIGDNPDLFWACGGTLITNRHVLSAAHCFVNLNQQAVRPAVARLGDLDLDPEVKDGATPLDVPIDRVITHERYLYGEKHINDIALLVLQDHVTFTKLIQPICMPIFANMRNVNYDRKTLTVTGWGSTFATELQERSQQRVTKLMEVQLPVTNPAECRQAYAGQRGAVIDGNVLCAGAPDGGKDSCRGDSGGPLMLMSREMQYYLIGVVSYGPKVCGVAGVPGVYTKVPSFIDWIVETIVKN